MQKMPSTLAADFPQNDLLQESLARLGKIFEPQVVAVPPTNAIRELMMLPGGEIRHYGFEGDFSLGAVSNIYLSSRDYGLSWTRHAANAICAGAMTRSPWSGEYLTVLLTHGTSSLEEFHSVNLYCSEPGMYVHRSVTGPDGPIVSHKTSELLPRMLAPRQPLPLKSRQRWVLPAHGRVGSHDLQCPLVFLSDDDAETWRMVGLPPIEGPGLVWPHAGLRWENCGPEPTVVELSDGRLYMLIRTAHDQFWEAFSSDAGDSWTPPAPSRFYGTTTTPLLFSLADSRLIVFWNNTTPLPELDHSKQPGLSEEEKEGIWEDFFTNRDVLHAAISDDDGKTWQGFRELHLNQRRNDGDFRSRGGNRISLDKSVHQSQAVELPLGKILLSFGQHPECRRMLIFDPEWLYETDRKEDFQMGLENWSYHQYLKSVPGGFRGFTGHCALNRRPGAALMPHPDDLCKEVLQIACHPDARLMDSRQGAVWSFPAGRSGRLRLRFKQPVGSLGAQIALVDRWFNPTDPVVPSFAQFILRIDRNGCINGLVGGGIDRWNELTVQWDLSTESAGKFSLNGGPEFPLDLGFPAENGISYIHFQSASSISDPAGILLEGIEKSSA
jgi:hypothetical protein